MPSKNNFKSQTKRDSARTALIIAVATLATSLVLMAVVLLVLSSGKGLEIQVSEKYLDFNHLLSQTFAYWLTPFFAFSAAILTFLAFYIQYRSNKQQIERMDEMDRERKQQDFENNFYQLLQNHNMLTHSIEYDIPDIVPANAERTEFRDSGEIVIRKGLNWINSFSLYLNLKILEKKAESKEEIMAVFHQVYDQYQSVLSQLLRNLFLFVKEIDDSPLLHSFEEKDEIEKIDFKDGELEKMKTAQGGQVKSGPLVSPIRLRFMKLLSSQLSTDMLYILAMNCFLPQGRDFEFYVRKYRLLKNINLGGLPSPVKEMLVEEFPHLRTS